MHKISTFSAFAFCALALPALAETFVLEKACPDPTDFHADGTSCGDKGCKFTAKLPTNTNETLNFALDSAPQTLKLLKNIGWNLVAGSQGNMHISCQYSGQPNPPAMAVLKYTALTQLPKDWTCTKEGMTLSCSVEK